MRVSTQPGTKNSNYRDLMGRVLCRGSSGSESVVLEPGSRVAATLPARGAPRIMPAEGAKVRVGPGRSSARPGSWPPAPLTASPLVPASSRAVLVLWPGAFRKTGGGGEQAAEALPPKFSSPGPSGRKSTQISLHWKPPNLGFDSVPRELKTGVEGSCALRLLVLKPDAQPWASRAA